MLVSDTAEGGEVSLAAITRIRTRRDQREDLDGIHIVEGQSDNDISGGDGELPSIDNLITANLAPDCLRQEKGVNQVNRGTTGLTDMRQRPAPRRALVRSNDGDSRKAEGEQDGSHRMRTVGEPNAAAKTLQTRDTGQTVMGGGGASETRGNPSDRAMLKYKPIIGARPPGGDGGVINESVERSDRADLRDNGKINNRYIERRTNDISQLGQVGEDGSDPDPDRVFPQLCGIAPDALDPPDAGEGRFPTELAFEQRIDRSLTHYWGQWGLAENGI